MPRFDPERVLQILECHGVRYVLIGGVAATLHGSPLRTGDTDICPARDDANLEGLAQALREMQAKIRAPDAPEGLPFACDAAFLRSVDMLNLVTKHGDVDITFVPSGTTGYADLERRVVRFDLDGLVVPAAALEDLIRSKSAAGRDKDRQALPVLEALLARHRGG